MLGLGKNYGLYFVNDSLNDTYHSSATSKQDAREMSFMMTDIIDSGDSHVLLIEVPGYKKDEITVELKDGYLTIAAMKASAENEAKVNYIHRERFTRPCKRSFYVGEDLRQEDIKASLENGLLRLVIPKEVPKQSRMPKYISID